MRHSDEGFEKNFLSNVNYVPKLDTGDFGKNSSHSPILCFQADIKWALGTHK